MSQGSDIRGAGHPGALGDSELGTQKSPFQIATLILQLILPHVKKMNKNKISQKRAKQNGEITKEAELIHISSCELSIALSIWLQTAKHLDNFNNYIVC